MDGGALGAKVGQGHKIPGTAVLALGKVSYLHQFLLGPRHTPPALACGSRADLWCRLGG